MVALRLRASDPQPAGCKPALLSGGIALTQKKENTPLFTSGVLKISCLRRPQLAEAFGTTFTRRPPRSNATFPSTNAKIV